MCRREAAGAIAAATGTVILAEAIRGARRTRDPGEPRDLPLQATVAEHHTARDHHNREDGLISSETPEDTDARRVLGDALDSFDGDGDVFSLPLLDALFSEAPVGLGVFDRELRHVRVNAALADLNGYPVEEILGRTPAELHGELGAQAETLYRHVLDTGVPITGMEVSGSTGKDPDRERHWSLHYFPLRGDGDIVGLCVVVLEITDRVELERRLAHQATHDVLTGLPGRRLFLDRINHALERLHRHPATVAVLFGDLDRLKEINDRFGHAAGDAFIVAVAERLQRAVRSEDTVARWGGDEFVILLEDVIDGHEVDALAERIRLAVSAPLELEGDRVQPSITLGIALTDMYEKAEAVIRRADARMYGEKSVELFAGSA